MSLLRLTKAFKEIFFGIILLLLCVFPLEGAAFGELSPKVPQNPFYYLRGDFDKPLLTAQEQAKGAAVARDRFFLPWNGNFRHSKDDLLWPFGVYLPGRVYGENERPRQKNWFDDIYARANVEAFRSLDMPGIVIAEGALRAFPTFEPIFLSLDLPGEGYPFDYGQVSWVNPGEPIRISHFAQDCTWAYVETSFAAGWIDSRKVAYVNEDLMKRYASLPLSAVVKDDTAVSKDGRFLFNAKMGTLLPLNKELLYEMELLVPTGKDDAGFATFVLARLSKEKVKKWPVEFNQWNAARMIDEMIGETYGWGGLYGKRDCSAATRDLFLIFGIWLPRNSKAQARSAKPISLEGLTPDQKEKTIIKQGIPFGSLIYKPGHIMLYVGTYRGKAVVFHNLWGLKTHVKGKEGRYVIGQSILSTLDIGKDLPCIDRESLLINTVTAMINLL